MLLVQVDPELGSLLQDVTAHDSEARIGRNLDWNISCHFSYLGPNHLPGLLLCVVVHHGPEHHQLDAAALEERHLILLAELGEAVDLFGHLDDSLDGKLSQVDYTAKWIYNKTTLYYTEITEERVLIGKMWSPYERRLRIELVETQVFLLPDSFCQSSAGNEQLLQLGLLPVVERAEGRTPECLVLCRYRHVHNFPNTKRT